MMSSRLIGSAQLMRRAFAGENLESTARELLRRVELDSADAHALLDLAILFQLDGQPALGLEFQARALACRQHYRVQSSNADRPLRVLALAARGLIMDNMPAEFLLEHPSIQFEILYLGQGIQPPRRIPEHDVAIVTVCESDANQQLLEALEEVTARWPQAVVNPPSRIAQLSRDRLGKLVSPISGLRLVVSERMDRTDLQMDDCFASMRWRLSGAEECIVRPVGTHAGHGLERISSQAELEAYLQKNIAAEYFVAPFIDYRSLDGKYRKYRVALIGGHSYPVHMALSQRWMVHYLNADMLDNAKNRQEEADFMQHYTRGFGQRHRRALNHIAQSIGLDYVVLDCAETCDGELLLFEADNGAVVHSMDSDFLFPYKRPAMQRIFDATRHLLWARSQTARRARAA